MKIVISANPERWANVTFFDGIDNQIYPPHELSFNAIVDYIKDVCDEHDINSIIVLGADSYIKKLIANLKANFPTVEIKTV